MTTVVADVYRKAGPHLVLNRRAVAPVVWPHAPAAQKRRVDSGRIRIGVAEVQVCTGERTADIAASRARVLRGWTQQVAIDREVAVRVGPRPVGDRPDEVSGRALRGVDTVSGRRRQVAADADFQRGPAVAEEIVRQTKARADVMVAGHAVSA